MPTQQGAKGIQYDFNDGCRVVLPESDHPSPPHLRPPQSIIRQWSAAEIRAWRWASRCRRPRSSLSDPYQGDTIAAYQFWESTGNPQGGYFVVNGVAQALNQAINVAATQLSQTSFTAVTSPRRRSVMGVRQRRASSEGHAMIATTDA